VACGDTMVQLLTYTLKIGITVSERKMLYNILLLYYIDVLGFSSP
jgi:hypothetical protein